MKIDLMMYRANLPTLRAYRQANLNLSLSDLITNYAVSTHVPLIVCAFYMAKIEGMSDEAQRLIERLKSFYRYDEIIGIEELMKLEK